MDANFDGPPRGFRVTAGEDGAWTVLYRTTGMWSATLFFIVWLGGWTVLCLFFTGVGLRALFDPVGSNYAVLGLLFTVPFWGAEYLMVHYVAWLFLSVTRFTFGTDELVVEQSLWRSRHRRSFPRRSVTAVKQIKDGGETDDFPTWGLVVITGEVIPVLCRQPIDKSNWLGPVIAQWAGAPYVPYVSPWGKTCETKRIDDWIGEHLTQPADSTVIVMKHTAGTTVIVPPQGIWRGGGCFLLFSMLWLGAALVCALAGYGLIPLQNQGQGDAWAGFWFCLLPWLGVFLFALSLGRRRAVIAVEGSTLRVRVAGLFRTRERCWACDDIAHIRTGPSGAEVNDESVLELQIHPRQGKQFRLLSWRGSEELEWLAGVLRQLLRPRAVDPRQEAGGSGVDSG
jgi:hypothetical protein